MAAKLVIAGLAAVLALSACVTANSTSTGVDANGRRAFLTYAGADAPVYLTAVNPAFGSPQEVAREVALSADQSVVGSPVTFTTERSETALPHYRIVALFDPEVSVSTDQVCRSDQTPPVAARYQDRTNLFLAFCARGEEIAGARVSGAKLSGPDDPELDRMVKAGMSEMFPPHGGGDRGNPPVFGSLGFDGGVPRFRLNPLAGVAGE
ncbi:MAG: hypothetical protein NXI19_09795 [Alphaproteobacteria bacterium]|nr:hypothetical protein [Alphaproteobacteria bacterium]